MPPTPLPQVAAAARAPLPEDQLEEVRRRAATAATTIPAREHIYSSLPPPAPPPPAGCLTAGSTSGKVSPAKAAAPAGARKQLDGRWVAEQQELRPRLEDLWLPAERVPQRTGLPDAVLPLAVPLPDARQLAACYLGLSL